MKIHRILTSASSTALLGAAMLSVNVFADSNYDIVYNGGAPLSGTNVNVDSDLINGLSPLIRGGSGVGGSEISVTGANWQKGYHHRSTDTEECTAISYFMVSNTSLSTQPHTITIKNEKYQIDVDLVNASAIETGDSRIAVGIEPGTNGNGFIYGGHAIYSTYNGCVNKDANDKVSDMLSRKSATNRLFLETNIKLRKLGSDSVFTIGDDKLFFSITDIDQAQSYKILNQGNTLSNQNMYTVDAKLLQPEVNFDTGALPATCAATGPSDTSPTAPYLNCFKDGYIYSQYNTAEGEAVYAASGSDIYVSLKEQTQQDGLKMVFGYAGGAGSSVRFYARQFDVTYVSDDNGEIVGIDSELVISGDTATGTAQEPKEGYKLNYWIADVDVTLKDGTVIKKDEPITSADVRNVVITQNVKFTAIHQSVGGGESEDGTEEEKVATPNTGSNTRDVNGILVPISIVGVLAGALIIRALPLLTHKKVKFEK